MAKKFYITTAIAYASGKPHIGHAYEYVLSDVIARLKRNIGYDVMFLTGMDEHGQKIAEKAIENSKDPKTWVDEKAEDFKKLDVDLDISYDKYIRTTDEYHVEAVQKIFSKFLKDDLIYLGNWESLYCVGCEESYTDSEAVKHEDGELYCKVGHKLTKKNEESYFFKMSKFNEWIKDFLKKDSTFIIPSSTINELFGSFLNSGVEDLSVSRTNSSWDITILENPKHTIYVWLDALMNYITALGYESQDDSLFKKYWEDESCEVLHVIGKDISRFHAIYWPIFLKALDVREPSKILTHGFILDASGRKMSKSFGNVIDPNELLEKYGRDTVRYYFAKELIATENNNFNEEKMQEVYNSDLANIYGNLISRFLGIIKKTGNVIKKNNDNKNEFDQKIIDDMNYFLENIENKINLFEVDKVLNMILDLGKSANKYIENTKPWELIKNDDLETYNNFLFYLSNCIKIIVSFLRTILTDGSKKMIAQMNFNDEILKFENLSNFENLNGHIVNDKSEIIYLRK